MYILYGIMVVQYTMYTCIMGIMVVQCTLYTVNVQWTTMVNKKTCTRFTSNYLSLHLLEQKVYDE